jgi:hypothetical protein
MSEKKKREVTLSEQAHSMIRNGTKKPETRQVGSEQAIDIAKTWDRSPYPETSPEIGAKQENPYGSAYSKEWYEQEKIKRKKP